MTTKGDISGFGLKVLILEDSPYDLELIQELLSSAGYVLNSKHVENEGDFRQALLEDSFDMILSDFSLPGFNAFGALHIRNELCEDIPFICISGSIGEETAIELLKLGAVDYVLKDRPERLPFAVERALKEAKENRAYKQAVKDLQESKIRFEQVAEDAQEWIWEVDSDGLYLYSSPVVESLMGYSVDEVVGRMHFYDFFTPEAREELQAAAFQVFEDRKPFRQFINSNRHKDGHLVILTSSGSPFFDEEGHFLGYRGVDSDITERSKILEELLAAKVKAEESDQLKTAFINNISHEIRTPLNSILGFGQFLSEEDLSKEERKEYFSIIEKSGNRLLNTVSDYIDMARIVTGDMDVHEKEFLVQPFFEGVVQSYKNNCDARNMVFETVVPQMPFDRKVHSEPEFIAKILRILLDNALKFCKEGTIRCRYEVTSESLLFSVQDTGPGIADDKQERIFDMFSQEDLSNTRGHEGSGLGLSIAKGLIELLGGKITVSSEKGKGSTFTFTVPNRTVELASETEVAPAKGSTENEKPLILIAEDDMSNYLYLRVLLDQLGIRHLHAGNGAEAVDHCRTTDDITLVLMDIRMPVMNGLEATELIHSFKPAMPIIATTAFAQSGDEHRFISAGCDGYLSKPINKNQLIELVQKYAPSN